MDVCPWICLCPPLTKPITVETWNFVLALSYSKSKTFFVKVSSLKISHVTRLFPYPCDCLVESRVTFGRGFLIFIHIYVYFSLLVIQRQGPKIWYTESPRANLKTFSFSKKCLCLRVRGIFAHHCHFVMSSFHRLSNHLIYLVMFDSSV